MFDSFVSRKRVAFKYTNSVVLPIVKNTEKMLYFASLLDTISYALTCCSFSVDLSHMQQLKPDIKCCVLVQTSMLPIWNILTQSKGGWRTEFGRLWLGLDPSGWMAQNEKLLTVWTRKIHKLAQFITRKM